MVFNLHQSDLSDYLFSFRDVEWKVERNLLKLFYVRNARPRENTISFVRYAYNQPEYIAAMRQTAEGYWLSHLFWFIVRTDFAKHRNFVSKWMWGIYWFTFGIPAFILVLVTWLTFTMMTWMKTKETLEAIMGYGALVSTVHVPDVNMQKEEPIHVATTQPVVPHEKKFESISEKLDD